MASNTAYQNRAGVADRFAGVVNQLAERADAISGNRLGRYLDRYAETAPSKTFSGNAFGVEFALRSTTHVPLTETIREVATFTIDEARDRLQAFLDGSFVPESIHDLIEYLGEKFLRIETHSHRDGQTVNYLVDTRSGAAVPAHQVDPRLSHAAMLQTRLRESMRRQFGSTSPASAFTSWQGMMFASDDDPSGVSYTVSGKEAWYGRIYGIASTDPEANRLMLEKARAAGVELIVPHRVGDSASEMIAGMPVLRRVASVRAENLNPAFSHDNLSLAFGKSMFTAYEEMFSSSRTKAAALGGSVAISTEDFLSKFIRSADDDIPSFAGDDDEGFASEESGVRDLVVRRAASDDLRLYVFDRDLEEEIAISPQNLLPGEYERETERGEHEGYTIVNEEGRMLHLDLDRQRTSLAVRTSEEARAGSDQAAGRRPH